MRSPANIHLDKTGDCSTEAITNEHHKKSTGVRMQLKTKVSNVRDQSYNSCEGTSKNH